MKNIIFHHKHQNGDSFTSRIFVKHFIENTTGYNYYYTSENSLESHCEDIGIPKENFNVYESPQSTDIFYEDGDNLYINTWIGQYTKGGCLWCLNGFIQFYNSIIEGLKRYGIEIPPMDDNCQRFLPIEREFEYKVDPKYKKVVVIYNCDIKTFFIMNNVKHAMYINELAKRHPDYLFVTFIKSESSYENVVQFKDIVKGELPPGYAIDLACFNRVADKVLFLPSGVSQIGFYHEKDVKNKYAILYYLDRYHYVPQKWLPTNDRDRDYMCIDKYGFHIKKIWIDRLETYESLINQIDNFIS